MIAFVPDLPLSVWVAMRRGAAGKCPRCAKTRLFARFLKPVDRCALCGQDWSLHSADDFPPYVSILVTGHLMAPVMILLGSSTYLPTWALVAIALVMATSLLMGMLQPAKGAIIALQWWNGMHGFAPHPGKLEARKE